MIAVFRTLVFPPNQILEYVVIQLCTYIGGFASSSSSTCESQGCEMNEYMSINRILMLTGYFVIGVALFLALTLWMCRNGKRKEAKMDEAKGKVGGVDESGATEQFKGMTSKSASPSMVVLRSLEVKGLKFEELLKTPAELLGRGKHGSVYKVMCEKSRMTLSVKRIKDWGITGPDFKKRMQRLEQLKHPNVLRALAFYSSSLEKLIVYEYQQNGSLLRLVQGIVCFPFQFQFQINVSES